VSNKTFCLTDPLHAYLVANSVREHPLLAELRAATAAEPRAHMQIAPEQGQFMGLLAELTGARRCLEIGVFTGYSSLALALALPADGSIVACDISEPWAAIAMSFWRRAGVDDKIDLRLAPALETLDALIAGGGGETFDFAFIDADKANYEQYYERCLLLARRGGLIAVDNTLWSGRVADPANREADTECLRRFNARLRDDARVSLSLVPIGDGLTLARKR
jgi:predicted O-methyltransferase YrrM